MRLNRTGIFATAQLVGSFLVASICLADEERSALLDVFPGSSFHTKGGTTEFTKDFTPSVSLWDERLDERQVFLAELKHQQTDDLGFQLRIGRGGQIYSLRGSFGESVPPSWRQPGGKLSPWNDEVWQFVAVCTKYNGLMSSKKNRLPAELIKTWTESGFADGYFIHNSGAYIPGESELHSLYCPLLASEWDSQQRCFRMLNWGLVPQVRTIHRSPILYYTQIRDAGDGVIELTWVVHNFSQRPDIVFDHLNAPWGGTRISSLPLRYVSSPDGKLLIRKGLLSEHGTIDVRKTGGWNISLQSDADDAPALALVYGRDKHLEAERRRKAKGEPYCQTTHSLYRDWRANEGNYSKGGRWDDWATRPANSFRNYDVCEIIPKLRIAPGTSIWFRSYLVVGSKDHVIRQATELVGHVDYGLVTPSPESAKLLPHRIPEVKAELYTYSRPVPKSLPLFHIRNADSGQEVITTDPYFFVERTPLQLKAPTNHPAAEYLQQATGYSMDKNHSQWKSLIGFAPVDSPGDGWQKLSTVLPKQIFPTKDAPGQHRDVWVRTSVELGTSK